MRNWTVVQDELIALQSQPCVFPAALSSDIQKRLLTHNHYVIDRLIILIGLPLADNEKERRIRLFLAMRWSMIVNSSIDYTLNPNFPANIACLKIATLIAKKDEAACQILMPSIRKIIGTGFSAEDVKSASENRNGQFDPHDFLIHLNGEALISVSDLFEFARVNTHHLFSSKEKAENAFDLSAEDRERIRIIAGEASVRYFNGLKCVHIAQQGQKPSIGFALKELQLALLKSSKAGDGSEEAANIAECRQPILQFYHLWTGLSDRIKTKIKNYKARHDTFSLESYLLCLFARVKEFALEIIITETQYKRVLLEKIFPCTHQIALALDSLLKHNPDLFNFLLPGFERASQAQLPSAKELDQLSQRLMEALKNRSPIQGLNDQRCIDCLPCLEILSRHCFDETIFPNDIAELARTVKTVDELIYALIVLPTQYWEFFIKEKRHFVCESIKCSRSGLSSVFAYILTRLHSRNWGSFFNALCAANMPFLLNGNDLGLLQNKFSETEKHLLVSAMGKMLDHALSDGVDLVYLFRATPIDHWGKVFALFAHRIEIVLENPIEFAFTIKLIPANDRIILIHLFKSVIEKNIKKSEFLEAVLSNMPADDRIHFLKMIENHLNQLEIDQPGFLQLLRLFKLTNWAAVLTFCSHQAKKIIKNDRDLSNFLNRLSSVECVIFLGEMPSNIINIEITATRLHVFLMRFSDCELALLRFFKMQLAGILSGCLSTFRDDFENDVPPDVKVPFKYIALRALPLLLTHLNLSLFCPSLLQSTIRFSGSSPNCILGVYQAIRRIDQDIAKDEISMLTGCIRRVKILHSFIQKTQEGQFPRTSFYDELTTYFGKEFFSKLSVLLPQLQAAVPFPVTPPPMLRQHQLGMR